MKSSVREDHTHPEPVWSEGIKAGMPKSVGTDEQAV